MRVCVGGGRAVKAEWVMLCRLVLSGVACAAPSLHVRCRRDGEPDSASDRADGGPPAGPGAAPVQEARAGMLLASLPIECESFFYLLNGIETFDARNWTILLWEHLLMVLGTSPRYTQIVPKWLLAGQLVGTDFGNTRAPGTNLGGFGVVKNGGGK